MVVKQALVYQQNKPITYSIYIYIYIYIFVVCFISLFAVLMECLCIFIV